MISLFKFWIKIIFSILFPEMFLILIHFVSLFYNEKHM